MYFRLKDSLRKKKHYELLNEILLMKMVKVVEENPLPSKKGVRN